VQHKGKNFPRHVFRQKKRRERARVLKKNVRGGEALQGGKSATPPCRGGKIGERKKKDPLMAQQPSTTGEMKKMGKKKKKKKERKKRPKTGKNRPLPKKEE